MSLVSARPRRRRARRGGGGRGELAEVQHFTAKRRAIRDALAADGVAAEIEALVEALLPP